MTFKELLTAARFDLSDTPADRDENQALPRAQALRFFNEAVREACRRARLLVDRGMVVAVTAGEPVVDLDPCVIKIRKAALVSRSEPLKRKYAADMDEKNSNWESHTGTTNSYIADYETNAIFLYPIPALDDTLKLTVVRTPLIDMVRDTDTPEIPARFHDALVPYVVFKARSIEDSELYDPRKAAAAMVDFEKEFGPKRSAKDEMYENSQPLPEWE